MFGNKGFTLIEVLVALFIMSIGFLALSQMQYLSLKQSQLAYSGTTASNLIQSLSDIDLSRIRIINRNNIVLVNDIISGNGNNTHQDYCNNNLCNNECPCDPFHAFTAFADEDSPLSICTAIKNEYHKLNFDETIISTNPAVSCNNTANEYFLTRTINVDTRVPGERTYNIAYTIKNRYQQVNYPDELGNSLATQYIKISAHVDSTILASAPDGISNLLVIPNIP
jgi:prepilin-type N-terminal cleavage/methylation domain-containing protein